MLKLEKLDRRHNGSAWFTHRAYVTGLPAADKAKEFIEVREWCWATFGPSCELAIYNHHPRRANWAWRYDDSSSYDTQHYIYFTEEARSLFTLKWT